MAVASILARSVTGVPESIPKDLPRRAMGELSHFRQVFYECLSRRRDELFELVDAVLCADGPVTSLVGLDAGG
jgi:hypothetical protein